MSETILNMLPLTEEEKAVFEAAAPDAVHLYAGAVCPGHSYPGLAKAQYGGPGGTFEVVPLYVGRD